MIKALLNLAICVTMIVGVNMEYKDIRHYITNYDKAIVIIQDTYYSNINYEEINAELNQMLDDAYSMPALGVSLHTQTLNELKNGVWLKLQYNGTQYVDDMPFDELLININPEFQGFNIIRGNKGIYDGRCYYINLTNKTMEALYNYITLNFNND